MGSYVTNGELTIDEAMKLFEIYCRAKGLSPRTVETYVSSVRYLSEYLGSSVSLPAHTQLRKFIAWMLDRGLSRQTIRVRIRSIRVFYGFLVREGILSSNPIDQVEIPRVPDTLPTVLTNEQISLLLKELRGKSWHQVRSRAIVLCFLDTGLRLSELVNLDLHDLDLRTASLLIRNGKGAKDRIVYAGQILRRTLRQWLDMRGVASPCSALFSTNRDTRIHRRAVGRIVEYAASNAGLSELRVHPHALRHTFATAYIRNGGDVFSLQRLLGHSDIKTTMIYVNLAGVDLEEAHAKASPVDRLSSSR